MTWHFRERQKWVDPAAIHYNTWIPYEIDFTPDAADQFREFRKYDQVRLRDAMDRHLSNEPEKETRNKKRIDSELVAAYELRVGDFRVFYDIRADEMAVVIEAIGIKRNAQLFIGGEEVEL